MTRTPFALLVVTSALSFSHASRLASFYGARLRGGGADESSEPHDPVRVEIQKKLNGCPCFCILNEDGVQLGVLGEDGGLTVGWYTEPADAMAQLAAMQEGSPDGAEGLHLGCMGLGDIFALCGGWDESEGGAERNEKRVIYGPRKVVEVAAPMLVEQLNKQGMDPGDWQLPVFCHDDFQTDTLMPFFFSAEELASGWARNGREGPAPENPLVMDLRMLVNAMTQNADVRGKATVVTSTESYALASELITALRAKEASESADDESEAGDADAAAEDKEEEDDDPTLE